MPGSGDTGEWANIPENHSDKCPVHAIDALKKAEEEAIMVTKNDGPFRQVVESAPNAMVLVTSTGLIKMVNAQTERIFGYSRDELLGKPVEKLMPERYRSNHQGLRMSFFAGLLSRPMGAGRDLLGLRKDGSEFPIEIGLSPIETDDGTMVLSAIVDISDRKEEEERIHTAVRKLAHMNRVATVGELSASIAHEVNQPVAAMIANANAALRWLERATPNLDEAHAALKRIVNDGHRAGDVIASLRAMFRKDSVEKSTLDLNNLIEDVLRLARAELEAHGILVQMGLIRPFPLVLGNSNQLQQVISNLVKNATDAMESVSGRPRVLRVNSQFQAPAWCWCRLRTPEQASIRTISTASSIRFSQRSRKAWEWGCRSAGQSSMTMVVGFGLRLALVMAPLFISNSQHSGQKPNSGRSELLRPSRYTGRLNGATASWQVHLNPPAHSR